jgi:hypothetical protein
LDYPYNFRYNTHSLWTKSVEEMMRHATVFAALLAAAANAQKFGAKANCTKLVDVKPVPDPFTMFTPGKADFHCDMGVPIPFGPVPPGCAKLEVIYGESHGTAL